MPTLSSLREGFEPLISDSRLEAVEARVRRENPGIPENAVFLAYIEPQQEIEAEVKGIMRPVPIAARACFSIFVPHPKYPHRPGFGYLATGRMFYDQRDADRHDQRAWRTLEHDRRHSAELDSDPAYLAFSLGPVKEAVAWYQSAKDLNTTAGKVALDGASR